MEPAAVLRCAAMGKDVAPIVVSREDRLRYREKVRRDLDVFDRMLGAAAFDVAPSSMGLEIELNLIDADGRPMMRNAEVLQAIADEAFQTEVGQWNIEINVAPRMMAGRGLAEFERDVRDDLNEAEAKAKHAGANIVMVGILPTLAEWDTTIETLSANPRYAILNEQIISARGEHLHIDIRGREELDVYSDTVVPEGACTSVQIHLQVSPEEFAAYWNASQAIAGIQVALARELALPLRARALAGDAHRPVPPGDRHASGGAQGPGRPSPGVVRRAVDHLDLRPVRGERPLLPGTAPAL